MLRHMLQRDPRQRSSAAAYRLQYTQSIFPAYFDAFLFRFMSLVLSRGGKLPDARIRLVCKYYGRIVRELVGVDDKEGEAFFTHRLKEGYGSDRSHFTDDVAQRMYSEMEHPLDGMPPPLDASDDVAETLLSTQAKFSVYAKRKHETLKRMKKASVKPSASIREEDPMHVVDDGDVLPASDNGIMIILSLLCSSVRHCGVPQSKLTALQLITRLGAFADDEVRLQRLVPFVMEVLDDACAAVRAEAIRCVSSLLSLVKIFPLSDAAIFPQYILPALQHFPSDAEEMVRIAFAECLPSLAESARRFLEISCTLKMRALHATSTSTSLETTARQTKSKTTKDGKNGDATFSTFDDELNRLHLLVSRFVIQIAAPDQKASSSLVKRALLHDITRLCIFFGRERTLDVVLPQLITFLNDRDWELRATFSSLSRACARLSATSRSSSLIDIQELVIARALLCLANLCALDMFQRTALLEKAKLTAPLLLHPGWWVRSAILKLLAAIAKEMDVVDRNVFLLPLVHPYLRKKVRLCKDDDVAIVLRDALRPHVSREAFDAALMARNGPHLLLPAGDDAYVDDDETMSRAESGDESFHLESSTPARRMKFNSEDSLDGSSTLHDLKKSTSAQAIARYERYYVGSSAHDEGVRLALMHQYIAMASMHMRSKIQLTNSEQVARYNGSDAPFVPFTRKIPKSSLHSLRVPSMKVALTVPLPLKPFSAVLKQSSKKDREAGLIKWESMPLAHIIRLYGLQTGSLATDAYQSVYDESATRAKVLQHDHVHDPALFHSHKLLARLTALDIPPLPLDMGPLRTNEGAVYSHAMTTATPASLPVTTALPASAPPTPSSTPSSLPPTPSSALGTPSSAIGPIVPSAASNAAEMFRNWRPRESVLAAELTEHTGPVHRLGVAQDSSFLASASSDGTVKLWSVRSLAHSINQGSRGTYDAQGGVLTDMVVCENSHSLATSSSNGSVHVVRVERMSSTGALLTVPLRDMHVPNDAVVVLDYMNNVTESLLVYGTRSGAIYGWDLRFRRQAWKLQVSVELGHMTCITHSSDATWLAVGTSRGYICLWDLRYHLLIRVWRHSSFHAIQRLEPCYVVASRPDAARNSPLVYVAAGDAEVAVFDLSIGACRGVFRTLHTQVQLSEADACPTLHHVQVPSRSKDVLASVLGPQNFTQALDEIAATTTTEEPTVRAIVTPSEYSLLTAGEDRRIRFWDLRNPKKSLTVCGGDASSFYDSQDAPSGWWKLKGDESKMDPPTIHLCQDASSYFGDSTADGVAPNPALERRGPIPPSPAHNDCILDLKLVDVNGPMVVSSARDGVVKVWR
ncbi:hypothetical protein SPRG_04931 [Saprolegnia parasitica CBS 223.65]|uniref:non-specific serine/threonine protein kinase n=1 Tax=Saprolegnia parasitica (strain CBS 223.65) TaxID=695850 RepID=A0A067CH76_SAPPC|nr:hypothetical protein SPRG_04931 [Saprolegnia parasitica CBS 223.65]KDO29848.1 hypothetical protein SPRG_04931 [Saprolegnia parasitica CBS 223.65]|eukprot:XP_012199459.1 hypothetical protein SPRG_04931 [Saprolegnia parasitica CBS 223.65]